MNYKKYLHIIAKVLFTAVLLLPIVGTTGWLGEATRELYNTDAAFGFITQLTNDAAYISYMMAVVHVFALIALWTRREALAVLLELPIIANIIGFHAFLDGGLLTGGAILANIYLLLILYLLYANRETLKTLINQKRNDYAKQ